MSQANLKEKYRKLVLLLFQKTNQNSILWSYNEFENRPATEVAGRVIYLDESINNSGEPIVTVVIENSDGNKIEAFDDEFIGNLKPDISGYSSYYEVMVALRENAIRAATGADADLDAILDELDDHIPF
jgi:hypothetical protein